MRTLIARACVLTVGLTLSIMPSAVPAWQIKVPSEILFERLGQEYGAPVEQRYRKLFSLLQNEAKLSRNAQLAAVNDFFNAIEWRDDLSHWGVKDYWQTPLETMTSFTGDCEDIAIAKYTALRMLGLPDSQLALVYVRIDRPPEYVKAPHMVLAFFERDGADPWVLDSIETALKADRDRPDLESVYEFNTSTLWLTDYHMHKLGKHMDASRLALERELKQRLVHNRNHLIELNDGTPFYPFELDAL